MAASRCNATVLLVAAFAADTLAHPQLHRRALARLGCRVVALDLDRGPGWVGRLIGRTTLQHRLGCALARHAPDLVLVLDAPAVPAETVASLRRASHAKWICWVSDELDGARLAALVAAAPAFDAVFVAGMDAAEMLDEVGLPRAGYLPAGCDPSVHRPLTARDRFRANVVFAGHATARRERLLGQLTEFGLAVWGPGWRRTPLRDYCRGERLSLPDYVRAYAGASVGVNIHRDEDRPGAGCNRRLFELAAIGVPQVCDARSDLCRHFEPGAEVLVYHDEGELKALVRETLHDPAAAGQLAAAARRRALEQHTLMHRMAALLDTALLSHAV
ncbi:MAG TPA: glycosyltransferase [Gemmatimonadales bacterium]|nr:glycosyltransferase [Gemmatimonadales bacterium]